MLIYKNIILLHHLFIQQKKVFYYNELLKINKNTPRSQYRFVKTRHNTQNCGSVCEYNGENTCNPSSSFDSESPHTTETQQNLILCENINKQQPTVTCSEVDDISNRPVVNFLLDEQISEDKPTKMYSISKLSTNTDMYHTAQSIPLLQCNLPCCNIDEMVKEADYAISLGILPQRIHQGSSGSYFVKNSEQQVIAVFKPKNEEPYGHLNPKWLKWMHKTCLPCCFGRSCILPNQGYLSEVAASVVDNYLGINIVPKTTLAWLSSPTFNYGRIDRSNLKAKRLLTKSMPSSVCKKFRCELPPKVGSFQLFVHGYSTSNEFLSKINSESFYESNLGLIFLEQFQKMTVFDYFIRNTDRGNDNWLIKCKDNICMDSPNFWERIRHSSDDNNNNNTEELISLVAIDNGLAFPFKHPDSWRSYPFLWAWLPCAKFPYLDSIKTFFLPKLTSLDAIDDLICRLHALFSIDKGFSEERFEDQISVMKGQIYNICNAFRNNMSPFDMVKQNPIYIRSQEAWDVSVVSEENVHKKTPLFSCF